MGGGNDEREQTINQLLTGELWTPLPHVSRICTCGCLHAAVCWLACITCLPFTIAFPLSPLLQLCPVSHLPCPFPAALPSGPSQRWTALRATPA
jgi:hypothetical protein